MDTYREQQQLEALWAAGEAPWKICRNVRRILQRKTVWVTGHTGFKGAWLSQWLQHLGARVHGFALAPHAPPNLHETLAPDTFASETIGGLSDFELVQQPRTVQPEIVFHLAAQPLVRRSYEAPLETATTNILGTVHVLEACVCIVNIARGRGDQRQVLRNDGAIMRLAKRIRWAGTTFIRPAKLRRKS